MTILEILNTPNLDNPNFYNLKIKLKKINKKLDFSIIRIMVYNQLSEFILYLIYQLKI